MRRSEEPRHKSEKKFRFYGTVSFLTCFIDPRKPHKKYPNFTSLHHFDVDIPENFQNKSICFSQFSRNFVQKNIHLWHSELLDMFLCWFPKIELKNIQNSPPRHFEVDILGNFQKWEFVFLNFFDILFSDLHLGSSDRPPNTEDFSTVVGNFLPRFYQIVQKTFSMLL